MPPFVASKHLKKSKEKEDVKEDIKEFNFEVTILASAKKSKLSFEELNLMSLNDFFDYLDIFIGKDEEKETIKDADQNDIDNFYSYM